MEQQYQRHIIVIINNIAYGEYEQVVKMTNGVRFTSGELEEIFGRARLDPVDARTFHFPDFQYIESEQPYWLGVVSTSGTNRFFLHFARLKLASPESIGTALLQVDSSVLRPLEQALTPNDLENLLGVTHSDDASEVSSQLPDRSRATIEAIVQALTTRNFPALSALLRGEGVPQDAINGYEESLTTYLSFPFVQHLDWSQVTSDVPIPELLDGQHTYIDVPVFGVGGDLIHLVFDCWRTDGAINVRFDQINA
ncbi:hypothetical protein JNN96_26455 [Mycobacterium sp. DSM 3803]|nr:hypothetical protein [Mycobacterium sp. DSM 3803]